MTQPSPGPSEPAASDPPVEPTGVEPTGVAAADDARRRLDELATAPLEEHVAVFEDAHRRLQEGLADLDEPS